MGEAQTITGGKINTSRFPGQWAQSESALFYNWHRHYDPSIGRYTQPDPLGFVDGPSVYAYAGNNPMSNVDPDGRVTGYVFIQGSDIAGVGVQVTDGFAAYNVESGTWDSFISAGVGAGFDIGAGGGVGFFTGGWCDLRGPSHSFNVSLLGVGASFSWTAGLDSPSKKNHEELGTVVRIHPSAGCAAVRLLVHDPKCQAWIRRGALWLRAVSTSNHLPGKRGDDETRSFWFPQLQLLVFFCF